MEKIKIMITRKPEPPPRRCRLCDTFRPARDFSDRHGLDVCFKCEIDVRNPAKGRPMPSTWPFLPTPESFKYVIALPPAVLVAREVLWETEREIDRRKANPLA